MKKILSFDFDPPIKTYTHHAYRLSIMSNHDHFLPWLYSNFIQFCSKDLGRYADGPPEMYRMHMDPPHGFNIYAFEKYYQPPGFVSHTIDRTIWAQNCKDFVAFLIASIDQGYYVWTHIDFFFVEGSTSYRKRRFAHGILILGYDLKKQTFQTASFNAQGNYTQSDIGFNQLYQAFGKVRIHVGQTEDIHLYRQKRVSSKLDLVWIKEQVLDYVNSRNTTSRFRLFASPEEGIYYGLDIYQKGIINHLNIAKNKPSLFKVHIPHILWEHKRLMYQRVEYLKSNGILAPNTTLPTLFSKVERLTQTLRMLLLKFRINQDVEILNRSLKLVATIQDKETKAMESLNTELNHV